MNDLSPHDFHVPEPLARLPRYLPWVSRPRVNGRVAKVPVTVTGYRSVPVNPLDAKHWQPLAGAQQAVAAGPADGVGLALTPDLGLVCLDVDACLTPGGQLDEQASALLARFPHSHAEFSPGGRGLHILVPGHVPRGWRRMDGVDLIDHGFVTVTGRVFREAATWDDCSEDLAAWHAEAAPRPVRCTSRKRSGVLGVQTTTDLLSRATRARNGEKFTALWRGDLAGYRSASEADVALTMMLMHWGGPALTDEDVLALLRQSGRHRSKWETPFRGWDSGPG